MQALRGLRESGIRVRVVTNSLASTDEPAVYAGYAKYQRALLEAGIELYEISPAAVREGAGREPETRRRRAARQRPVARRAARARSLIFDCRTFFVGSMNLDPRSAFTNTEIGFVVDAPEADAPSRHRGRLAHKTYRLELGRSRAGRRSNGSAWSTAAKSAHAKEPMTSGWKRFKSWFYSLLPIEPLL